MKKITSALLSAILLIVLASQAYAAEGNPGNKKYEVEEVTNNGVNMYIISGEGTNKEEVAEYLNNYQLQKNSLQKKENNVQDVGTMAIDWTCYQEKTQVGYGSTNDARNTTTVGKCYGIDIFTFPFETEYLSAETGSQQAYWAGSPFYADQIVLSQQTKFSGWGITISAPPSVQVVNETASWTSEPVEDVFVVNVDRPRIEAKTSSVFGGGLTGIEIRDTSDIYVGSNIYRPQSVINL